MPLVVYTYIVINNPFKSVHNVLMDCEIPNI